MNKRLEAASARIRVSEEEVFGELRVTTTIWFGTLWLAPRLPKLYEKYPELKIDLMREERVLDLPMREADVAIRMKEKILFMNVVPSVKEPYTFMLFRLWKTT